MTDNNFGIFRFIWTTIVGAIGGLLLLAGFLFLWLVHAANLRDKYVTLFPIAVGAILLMVSIIVSRRQSTRRK